jgi:hypothetical protein
MHLKINSDRGNECSHLVAVIVAYVNISFIMLIAS